MSSVALWKTKLSPMKENSASEIKAVTYEGEQRVRKRERGYRTRGEEGQDQNVPMKENSASEMKPRYGPINSLPSKNYSCVKTQNPFWAQKKRKNEPGCRIIALHDIASNEQSCRIITLHDIASRGLQRPQKSKNGHFWCKKRLFLRNT